MQFFNLVSVSQRLVEQSVHIVKEKIRTTALEREELGEDVEYMYRGAGCHQCNQTGYKGRTAVHEIF